MVETHDWADLTQAIVMLFSGALVIIFGLSAGLLQMLIEAPGIRSLAKLGEKSLIAGRSKDDYIKREESIRYAAFIQGAANLIMGLTLFLSFENLGTYW